MNSTPANTSPLPMLKALACVAAAVLAFHLAYACTATSFLIFIYLICLVQLTRVRSGRQAFYSGLAVGFLIAALDLTFLWNIFSVATIALWLVFAFWIGLFVALGWTCRKQLGPVWCAVLLPFVWTGLEYFRSELYYLRFGWLNVGYAFSGAPSLSLLHHLGVYGIGFVLVAAVCGLNFLPNRLRLVANAVAIFALGILANLAPTTARANATAVPKANVTVAGVQLEFPSDASVVFHLDRLIKKYPDAQLLLLSEYTFDGPVPEKVKAWCRDHERYLVVGGKDAASNDNFFDTAFVIGPAGEITFRQAKCVPIQFFKDGLPATEQKLWESPWGRMGICVCYDLSYTRVTDELVRLGAQAIIAPTMDVESWGRHQHELHARIGPCRAAEYGIPILRVASSGISQLIDCNGQTRAIAPCPGDGAMLESGVNFGIAGTLPADRYLAPASVAITVLAGGLIIGLARQRSR